MCAAMPIDDPAGRFGRLFEAFERDLTAYALRRVERPEDAADVVAETFLVAWRRLDRIPPGDAARLWMFGVARKQLANQRRGQLRRSRLVDRLRHELPSAVAAVAVEPDEASAAVHRALRRLSEEDRELLMLAGWEGLSPGQIAAVVQLRPATLRSRLHRARRRLREELAREEATPAGGVLHLTEAS